MVSTSNPGKKYTERNYENLYSTLLQGSSQQVKLSLNVGIYKYPGDVVKRFFTLSLRNPHTLKVIMLNND